MYIQIQKYKNKVRIILIMRSDNSKIKAVIFDVGGVLQLSPKTRYTRKDLHVSGVHEALSKKLKISIDQYFDAIDQYYVKSINGEISKKELLKILSENLNYPKDKLEKFYYLTYKKKYRKNKKLYSIAKKLKKKGYKISILSDQWHLSKDALIPKKDLKIFDAVVTSCDVGIRKPNLEIYKMILKKLKIKSEESLFIDNQSWNIIPAHKMGMNTILFTDNKKLKEQLKHFDIKI